MTPGSFSGQVNATWMADGRIMQLETTLTYLSIFGKLWTAPAGSLVDGASIPRLFWRFIGSPFCGKYRRASVIHDVYCVKRTESWQEVHELFLEMMKVDGVPTVQRRMMFWAVWYCGPRWTHKQEG